MEKQRKPTIAGKLTGHFRRTLIAGLLLIVPVAITYLVLLLIFNFLDDILQPGIEAVFSREVRGLGVVILVPLVYFVGLFGANFLGKRLVRWLQVALLRLPIFNLIYSAAKELIESFSGDRVTGFKRVVVIEYPRANAWTFGFLTSTTKDENGKTFGLVYIPTAPTPNSGWVAMLPIEDIYDTDLSVPVAIRLVLSGGIVTPPQIRKIAQAPI